MPTKLESLAAEAMKLPPESRARLADLLVESLDASELGPIDRLWIDETRRRRAEVVSGVAETVSADMAHRRVREAVHPPATPVRE